MKLDSAGVTVFFRVISGTGSNSVAGKVIDAAATSMSAARLLRPISLSTTPRPILPATCRTKLWLSPFAVSSDSQINAVVPFGVYQSATLSVSTPAGNTPPLNLTIVPAISEVFRNPDGTAVAVNQDGTLNSSSNPEPAGSYVNIWVTGVNPPVPYPGYSGQIARAAKNYSCCAIAIGSVMPPVTYAGAALGIFQMNFRAVVDPLYVTSPVVNVTVIANNGTIAPSRDLRPLDPHPADTILSECGFSSAS